MLFNKKLLSALFLLGLCNISYAQSKPVQDTALNRKSSDTGYIKFDDTRKIAWSKDFQVVEINSSVDNAIQKAYFYKTTSKSAQPLIISLHTWSGDYRQKDDLSRFDNDIKKTVYVIEIPVSPLAPHMTRENRYY